MRLLIKLALYDGTNTTEMLDIGRCEHYDSRPSRGQPTSSDAAAQPETHYTAGSSPNLEPSAKEIGCAVDHGPSTGSG